MNKKYRLGVIIAIFVLLFSTSCITNRQKLYLQESPAKEKTAIPYQPYRLQVNDEIVYYLMTTNPAIQSLYNSSQGGSSDMQNMVTYRIYEDGTIMLPTVGKVKILNMTIREAEQTLSEQFKKIVVDAEIKMSIANNYFYVEGDGGKGRFYMYKDELNIFQALAMAGDISSIGDKENIKIIRRGNDGLDHITTLDIRRETIFSSEYYYIRPNDVIYIPTSKRAFFRIESLSDFLAIVALPISLTLSAMTFLKLK